MFLECTIHIKKMSEYILTPLVSEFESFVFLTCLKSVLRYQSQNYSSHKVNEAVSVQYVRPFSMTPIHFIFPTLL